MSRQHTYMYTSQGTIYGGRSNFNIAGKYAIIDQWGRHLYSSTGHVYKLLIYQAAALQS